VSKRNGDKARFHKQRKRKILIRARIRELRKALEHDKAAKETSMISAQRLLIAIIGVVLSAHVLFSQDLSTYRDFHIGMNLASVTTQTATNLSEAKVIHQRPAVIQELKWRPRPVRGESSFHTDPAQEMVFSFYNDELFRIVVTYDREKINGLTEKDLIEGISAMYGTATTPAVTVTSSPFSQISRDGTDSVIARWEDGQYSFNLLRPSYGSTLSLVIFSKQVDALARAAITEAVRLDKEEAPQREVARQKQQEADTRDAQEKARLVNKPTFRP
jgi:hypothetical protein